MAKELTKEDKAFLHWLRSQARAKGIEVEDDDHAFIERLRRLMPHVEKARAGQEG